MGAAGPRRWPLPGPHATGWWGEAAGGREGKGRGKKKKKVFGMGEEKKYYYFIINNNLKQKIY